MGDKELKLRYARQMAVPEIGLEGQKKLYGSKILVIGCGALGSMVSMQLAGAGIGCLGIADYDTVDISNLQRQFFFTSEEAGMQKVDLMAKKINKLNPDIKVEIHKGLITPKNAEEIFRNYDFIIDATDNPDSKKMTGEISFKAGKGCCIGGVSNFSGQVLTFLAKESRFEDYFGQVSADGFLPCSLSGVMGPAAALCASIQASEAIKYIAGVGELLNGRILIFNLLKNSFQCFVLD